MWHEYEWILPIKVLAALVEAIRKPAHRGREREREKERAFSVSDLNKKNAISRGKFFNGNYEIAHFRNIGVDHNSNFSLKLIGDYKKENDVIKSTVYFSITRKNLTSDFWFDEFEIRIYEGKSLSMS